MILDVLFLLIIAIAVFEGFRKGLVVAIFSFLGILIGLAAALKLSATVANYLRERTEISSAWLPILAFVLVLVGTMLLVRWAAVFIDKVIELAFLGWANKIGGALMYAFIYTILFSVAVFYLNEANILSEKTVGASFVYPYVQSWGPASIDLISSVFPFLKDVFKELQLFFEQVSTTIGS